MRDGSPQLEKSAQGALSNKTGLPFLLMVSRNDRYCDESHPSNNGWPGRNHPGHSSSRRSATSLIPSSTRTTSASNAISRSQRVLSGSVHQLHSSGTPHG